MERTDTFIDHVYRKTIAFVDQSDTSKSVKIDHLKLPEHLTYASQTKNVCQYVRYFNSYDLILGRFRT
jgi:hypothetical protein